MAPTITYPDPKDPDFFDFDWDDKAKKQLFESRILQLAETPDDDDNVPVPGSVDRVLGWDAMPLNEDNDYGFAENGFMGYVCEKAKGGTCYAFEVFYTDQRGWYIEIDPEELMCD